MSFIDSIGQTLGAYSAAKKGATFAVIFAAGLAIGMLLSQSACKSILSTSKSDTIYFHDTTNIIFEKPYVKYLSIPVATPSKIDSVSATLDTSIVTGADSTKLRVRYDWKQSLFTDIGALFFGVNIDTTRIIRSDTTIRHEITTDKPIIGNEVMIGIGAGLAAVVIGLLTFLFK